MRSATAENSSHILEMGEDNNRGFIVTEDLPECQDLRTWLESTRAGQGTPAENVVPREYADTAPAADVPVPAAPVESPANLMDDRGDATRRFQNPPPVMEPRFSPLSQDPGAPPYTTPTVAPPAPESSPGEFTGMFLTGNNVRPQPSTPAVPRNPDETVVTAPPPRRIAQKPGGFEVVFRSQKTRMTIAPPPLPPAAAAPPPPVASPPPAKAGVGVGEFTMMFSRENKGDAQPPAGGPHSSSLIDDLPLRPSPVSRGEMRDPIPPAPPRPSSASPGETGEFDAFFFNRAASGPPPATPANPSRGQGELTQLISPQREPSARLNSPGVAHANMGSPLPPFPPTPPNQSGIQSGGSGGGSGKGDFTQFFQADAGQRGNPAVPPNPPPTFSPVPSPPGRKNPGAVTLLMSSYKPPQPDSVPPPMPPVANPPSGPSIGFDGQGGGGYSGAFDNPSPPAAYIPPPAVSPPSVEPTPPPPKASTPGEYTRIFELPRRSAAVPPPVPQPAAPPSGVRPPAYPAAPPPMPVAPAVPYPPAPGYPVVAPPMPVAPPVPYPQAPAPPTPGYYAPPVQYQPPAPPAYPMAPAPVMPSYPQPMAAPPAAKPRRPYLIPLIILGCLFLTAIVVVIYFAIAH